MSYLTFKIISLVISVVILLIVLANRNNREDKRTAVRDDSDDAFQAWLKQASVYDMQKMLITALVKIEPENYKNDVDVTANDFQNRMKILFENLPKDLRTNIYPDEAVLLDYIEGATEEKPYPPTTHQKRDNLYKYFQNNFANGNLFDNEKFLKVMFLESTEDDKSGEDHDNESQNDGAEKKIDYRAIHDEMYYVEYKLIPHLVEFFNSQPNKASQIIINIYENLVTLQNNLRKINPFAFGKVSGEVMGDLEGECLVVYEFPKPIDTPLAKYGAIYINHAQQKYQYWTLEFSTNDKYVLGSMSTEQHMNYGQCTDMTKEEFVHEVCVKMGADETDLQPRNMINRKNLIELTDRSFKNVLESSTALVVCFYDFNKLSQTFISILDQLSQEYYGKIVVGIYDVYGGFENSASATKYDIKAVPSVLYFKEGKLVNMHIGIRSREELKTLFDNLLSK